MFSDKRHCCLILVNFGLRCLIYCLFIGSLCEALGFKNIDQHLEDCAKNLWQDFFSSTALGKDFTLKVSI